MQSNGSLGNMIEYDLDLKSLDGINSNNSSDIHTPALKPSFQSGTALSSMSRGNADDSLSCMLITANVGTIFEEVSMSLKN